MTTHPFIPFVNVAAFQLVFNQDGQIIENTFNLKHEAGWDVTTLVAACDALKAWWNTSARPQVATNVSLTKIIATDLASESAPGIDYTAGLPIVGDGGESGLPNNVTVVVKWLTALRGRSYRGRTYHIGLRPGLITASHLTGAASTQLTTVYTAYLVGLPTDDFIPVVCSRRQDNAWLTTGISTEIVGFSINSTLDSQRRRLPERGS